MKQLYNVLQIHGHLYITFALETVLYTPETSLMEVTNYGTHKHKYTYTEEKLCFIQIHANPKLNPTRLIAIYKTHPRHPTACISSRTKCVLRASWICRHAHHVVC